jgi:UDP-N-acetylglucosamine 4,6-dehydratase
MSIPTKTYVIIGGTGSLGTALAHRLSGTGSNCRVVVAARSERPIVEARRAYNSDVAVEFVDVRDPASIRDLLWRARPNVIVLAAAIKHIDLAEANVSECVRTNVTGVENVIRAVVEYVQTAPWGSRLTHLINISTDKACMPVNAYGMSKALGERLIIEAAHKYAGMCVFLNVRYGNVLTSSGSILPFFHSIVCGAGACAGSQKTAPAPPQAVLPLTDPNMTRFFMTLDASIALILRCIQHGRSGETWVSPAVSMRVGDIAEYFHELSGHAVPVVVVGTRPGEKMHETLVSALEAKRVYVQNVFNSKYYVIRPLFMNETGSGPGVPEGMCGAYRSDTVQVLSRSETFTLLHGVFLDQEDKL